VSTVCLALAGCLAQPQSQPRSASRTMPSTARPEARPAAPKPPRLENLPPASCTGDEELRLESVYVESDAVGVTAGGNCTVSLMEVRPGRRLSLQSHTGRAELWIVMDVGAEVQVGDTYRARAVARDIRRLYELDELPDKQTSLKIAEPWRPYQTIASWYLWRTTEENP